jgi:enoyl-CoA hydratase/carnithine racemase
VNARADGRLLLVRPGPLAELRRLCERLETEEQVLAIVVPFGDARAWTDAPAPPPRSDLEGAADALARTPHVTIAAIGGDCVDEQLELALACDLRVAVAGARLGFPGVAAGAVPGEPAIRRLAAMIGRSRVSDLVLTGRTIDGATAAEWGLAEVAAHDGDAVERATELGGLIGEGAPLAIRYAKEAVDRGYRMPLEDGLGLEGDLYAILQTTSDRSEGIRAFHERRSPRFRGS